MAKLLFLLDHRLEQEMDRQRGVGSEAGRAREQYGDSKDKIKQEVDVKPSGWLTF
jgi:uncharacterized protein YjbJ (UPF0337 family)